MHKRFLFIMLLCACHSAPEKDVHPAKPAVEDLRPKTSPHVDTTSPEVAESHKPTESKERKKLFDNKRPFEILSVVDTYARSTDEDSSKGRRWKLSKATIKQIVWNSKAVDGVPLDLGFLDFVCAKSVKIRQEGQLFKMEINAGSHFWISNEDTTVRFADFKKADKKYFFAGYSPE